MIGLSALESVKIGKNSFTRWYGYFYLKNCPKLEILNVDYGSFGSYTMCEIEDTPAMRSIVISDRERGSGNFRSTRSLELKGA